MTGIRRWNTLSLFLPLSPHRSSSLDRDKLFWHSRAHCPTANPDVCSVRIAGYVAACIVVVVDYARRH